MFEYPNFMRFEKDKLSKCRKCNRATKNLQYLNFKYKLSTVKYRYLINTIILK